MKRYIPILILVALGACHSDDPPTLPEKLPAYLYLDYQFDAEPDPTQWYNFTVLVRSEDNSGEYPDSVYYHYKVWDIAKGKTTIPIGSSREFVHKGDTVIERLSCALSRKGTVNPNGFNWPEKLRFKIDLAATVNIDTSFVNSECHYYHQGQLVDNAIDCQHFEDGCQMICEPVRDEYYYYYVNGFMPISGSISFPDYQQSFNLTVGTESIEGPWEHPGIVLTGELSDENYPIEIHCRITEGL